MLMKEFVCCVFEPRTERFRTFACVCIRNLEETFDDPVDYQNIPHSYTFTIRPRSLYERRKPISLIIYWTILSQSLEDDFVHIMRPQIHMSLSASG